MKRGFTFLECAIIIACIGMVVTLALPMIDQSRNRDVKAEMKQSGCVVIGYGGQQAEIRVYRCKGIEDLLTEREWRMRKVEKQ